MKGLIIGTLNVRNRDEKQKNISKDFFTTDNTNGPADAKAMAGGHGYGKAEKIL